MSTPAFTGVTPPLFVKITVSLDKQPLVLFIVQTNLVAPDLVGSMFIEDVGDAALANVIPLFVPEISQEPVSLAPTELADINPAGVPGQKDKSGPAYD